MRSGISTLSLICAIKVLHFRSVLTNQTSTVQELERSRKTSKPKYKYGHQHHTGNIFIRAFIWIYVAKIVVTWRLRHDHMEFILEICWVLWCSVSTGSSSRRRRSWMDRLSRASQPCREPLPPSSLWDTKQFHDGDTDASPHFFLISFSVSRILILTLWSSCTPAGLPPSTCSRTRTCWSTSWRHIPLCWCLPTPSEWE